MNWKISGLKAWLVVLGVAFVVVLVLILVLKLLLILIPLILILVLISYFFRMLNKVKKEKHPNYLNIKYKVK
ncbi:MAG TPA: hypothetical protein VJC39_00955 [Candidatus Nanoarchaeia archaeon]|nr:hypothetical protein [Candidatus Nanoarchaeia archaeon]